MGSLQEGPNWEGLIAKRLYAYIDSTFETTGFDITISKKKCCWRPPYRYFRLKE